MNSRLAHIRRIGSRHANRGAVLIISLIVLVAMTLGGIAILRSVDTTTLIAGNLAFKQRALHAADRGVTEAVAWLIANKGTLASDNAAAGYHSSQPFDWTSGSAWTNQKLAATDTGTGTDTAGNRTYYVIHRMCTCANTAYNGSCGSPAVANQCGIDNPTATATPKPVEGDTFTIGGVVFPSTGSVYYRVTVRSEGPRDTKSYIQSMITISI
ncbi:MAG: hypothetical protein ABL891_12660 [Burkholderiales bacterium]